VGEGECAMVGPLEGASLYHWPFCYHLRMEIDPFSDFFGGGWVACRDGH
jgi:hypothetical protein